MSIKEKILNGSCDDILEKLYCGSGIDRQKERYISAIDTFIKLYGDGDLKIFSAPGRTEVCGNHTDHQNGKVLTASVNLDAIAVAKKTDKNEIRITSSGYGEVVVDCTELDVVKSEEGTTKAIVRGVLNGIKSRGFIIGGFEAFVTSDVLSGSGLSSSAAFEVLVANILSGLYNDLSIDSVEIAKIGKEAENVYFGKPSGLLDQMASSVGGLINIDFFNFKTPKIKKLDVDFNDFNHTLCIVDTKGSHADLTDEYAAITQEMAAVSKFFSKDILSQISKEEFFEAIPKIRELAGDRAVLRAIHFYNENERVDKQVKALENGNFEEFKSIILESGDSSYKYLQNVYSNKNVKSQNVSLALAVSQTILGNNGVARVHGGGFAGTIQAFVKNDYVAEYKQKIEKIFGTNSCYILKIRSVGGTQVI